MYSNVEIYTVNKCEDQLRTCNNEEDPYNISCNVCNHRLPKLISKKMWTFNEIYVDTFRMQKSYVHDNFSKNFFINLGTMAAQNILKGMNGMMGKVYLPFQPHFFNQVHKIDAILNHFDISYLKKNDISKSNNKLAYSTMMNDNVIELQKSTKEEERHMITTKREIVNYGLNGLFTKEQYNVLLQPLTAEVTEYRYIVLCCKDELKDTKSMLMKLYIFHRHRYSCL